MKSLNITNTFAELSPEFYTRLEMQGLKHEVKLLSVNPRVAELLGISQKTWESQEFLEIMSGQTDLPGGVTLSAVYSGHQFGVWAGQLGDGRAHLLGAIQTDTVDHAWEIQLKGAGLTPYSRMGDGRAVLRSSIRDYLASAAMDGLNIPTTLALSITMSEDRVRRERVETAAIVARVAPSFVRFGSFQHWYANQRPDLLRELFDYVCEHFFADQLKKEYQNIKDKILDFLSIVTRKTAHLMAHWQSVGFVHGVMNTDNMSVLGLTIDYGPYGFMENFYPNWVINHSDHGGRYAFSQQVNVALWNLHQFANSFTLLGLEEDDLRAVLDNYADYFYDKFFDIHAQKLGVKELTSEDDELFNDFWTLLAEQAADFTLSFRRLADIDTDEEHWLSLFNRPEQAKAWLTRYKRRLEQDALCTADRKSLMNRINPLYTLRTYMAQEAIDDAQNGSAERLDFMLKILQSPFVEHPGAERYAEPSPFEKQNMMLSCSS
ncbi:MAG: YdiU family protein [Alcaligenaceae bacterium]|nr:YdiU family protein [Alcaligenaceae bacterium]